jgi:lipopolysaccharide/colanic/teichoic acid biosynthesis glycosyltransferase
MMVVRMPLRLIARDTTGISNDIAPDRLAPTGLKRAVDLSLGLALLITTLPVIVLAILAVCVESPGAPILRQTRYGLGGRLMTIYKLRTMYRAATDPAGRTAPCRGDPRITRVGRILRRTAIDELPQLINVLQGRMSLVGPRPHTPASTVDGRRFAEALPGYARRYRVPPGLTGAAQTAGWRGPVTTLTQLEHRVAWDLWYARHRCLGLDLRIILKTPWALLMAHGAIPPPGVDGGATLDGDLPRAQRRRGRSNGQTDISQRL